MTSAPPVDQAPGDDPLPVDPPPVDPPPDLPPDPIDSCALKGVACAGGIAGSIPTCAACAAVLPCLACAGVAAATIDTCLSFSDRCINTAAHPGDICALSNRCETGGLHCVDHVCIQSPGSEPQHCVTDRDCAPGLSCLLDSAGINPASGEPYGGKCWRARSDGELCAASAECITGHVCDPTSHSCRVAKCGETIGGPTPGCVCSADADCPNGFNCDSGRCVQVTVTVCSCDGTDAPGTCLSCGGGGGPTGGGGYWTYVPTCYYFWDERTFETCVTIDGDKTCSLDGVQEVLTDTVCF